MTDRKIFTSIARPGRYIGHEYNSVKKIWELTKIRFALIFPDLYEIGMSHQGLQILYHILNKRSEILAERCYSPDVDLERLLRQNRDPITSLESARPLTEFDVIGITLPYELCFSNILTILDLASIPFYSRDRDETFPLVLGGGACSFNPEPVADFFDAILLGDGEEAILEIADLMAHNKSVNISKNKQLDMLADIDGVYIPSHFQAEYDSSDQFIAIQPTDDRKEQIVRRTIKDLNEIDHLKHPIVPNAKIVHDRLGIEVARGCTRGCRFCQAGITYRPVRERRVEKIMELAERGLEDSGFEELALLSLSTGDYSCLEQALPRLMDKFDGKFISVAMPSMRVGTLTPTVMDQVKRVRKTGFTLAPEAGSERLRRVINKGITEDDLISTCREAFSLGWRVIKFYFMIGLPTETEQDIDQIIKLVKKALAVRNEGQSRGKTQINVSIGTFVPKPHTPFQWERQLSMEESMHYIRRLQDGLPRKGCNLRYHSPKTSYLEGVFSRGDRRLAKLLEVAWQAGARFDGWNEHFDLSIWQEAAEKCHLDFDSYLRSRSMDAPTPWQHLHTGVDIQFLKDELNKAKAEVYTPDCRYQGCQECGLCDFKTLFPIVYNRPGRKEEQDTSYPAKTTLPESGRITTSNETAHFKYIVHYSRIGDICYLGHLEILQAIFRVLRRAKIATNYSQGFNPSPKVSFGPALPVATESLAEFFIMDLKEPLKEVTATAELLNNKLLPGLKVTKIEPHSGKMPQTILTSYSLTLQRAITAEEKKRLVEFSNCASFIVGKTRKGKTRDIDIRPLIQGLTISSPGTVELELVTINAKPSIKPLEALTEVFALDKETALQTKIIKTDWKPVNF